jgi:hypothetical protein
LKIPIREFARRAGVTRQAAYIEVQRHNYETYLDGRGHLLVSETDPKVIEYLSRPYRHSPDDTQDDSRIFEDIQE